MNLIRYDVMCRAIDSAFQVDEVKDIRDKAMAMEAYSRQARNTEAEDRARKIRLRAERKAGELLSTMTKAKGAQGSGSNQHRKVVPLQDESAPKTLKQLGISETQSHRWQQLAEVPPEQFEAALNAPEKPTTSGILRASQEPKRAPIDPKALWFWGHLRDLEREGVLSIDPQTLLAEMTKPMRADTLRLAPLVCDWLEAIIHDQ